MRLLGELFLEIDCLLFETYLEMINLSATYLTCFADVRVLSVSVLFVTLLAN